MPCYSAWDEYLTPGTPEYQAARAALEAKLRAVRHAVDYYYGVHSFDVPPARYSADHIFIETAAENFQAQREVPEEHKIIEQLTHHLACDGVHFTELYDFVSILDSSDPAAAGYARVLMRCAHQLRAHPSDYQPRHRVASIPRASKRKLP